MTCQAMLFLFVMLTKLDQTGLSWFELAITNQVDTGVILRRKYNVPHKMEIPLLLLMLFMDKLDADVSARARKLHFFY